MVHVRFLILVIVSTMLCHAGCGNSRAAGEQRERTLSPPWAGGGTQVATERGGAAPATAPRATQAAATAAATRPAPQVEPPQRLFGTWVAQNVQAPIGQVDIRVTFRREGPVSIMAWSDIPLVGQVRSKTGPFHVTDHRLVSEAIRGGTSVKYWFTPEGQLVIQYEDGKTVVFEKQG